MKIRNIAFTIVFALLTTNVTLSAQPSASAHQSNPAAAPAKANWHNWLQWTKSCDELHTLLSKEGMGHFATELQAFQTKCLNELKEVDPKTKKPLFPSQVFAKNSGELAKITIDIITEFGRQYGVSHSSLQASVDNAKKDLSQKIRDLQMNKVVCPSNEAPAKENQDKLIDALRIFDLTTGLNKLFASTFNVAKLSTE